MSSRQDIVTSLIETAVCYLLYCYILITNFVYFSLSSAQEVYNAFQKLEIAEYKCFDDFQDLLSVDAWYIPGGEQRVTLYRAQGGSIVLRQGVFVNHIWIIWNPMFDEESEPFIIPYSKVLWDEFFNVAHGAWDLRSIPVVKITSV